MGGRWGRLMVGALFAPLLPVFRRGCVQRGIAALVGWQGAVPWRRLVFSALGFALAKACDGGRLPVNAALEVVEGLRDEIGCFAFPCGEEGHFAGVFAVPADAIEVHEGEQLSRLCVDRMSLVGGHSPVASKGIDLVVKGEEVFRE